MNKLSRLIFELLKKRRDDGGIHPPLPQYWKGYVSFKILVLDEKGKINSNSAQIKDFNFEVF